jgi:hypothetical protein
LTQATEEKDLDLESVEYRIATTAPCPIIDAHVHGKNKWLLCMKLVLQKSVPEHPVDKK